MDACIVIDMHGYCAGWHDVDAKSCYIYWIKYDMYEFLDHIQLLS